MSLGNDQLFDVPGPVSPGDPVRSAETNSERLALRVLADEVRSRTLRGGPEIGARRTAGGTIAYLKTTPKLKQPAPGFMPVRRGVGDAGNATPGIGLVVGWVDFLGAEGESATRAVPTLGGIALDAAGPPRATLADGSWTAWLRYRGTTATIEFLTLGSSIEDLAADERAVAVADFSLSTPAAEGDPPVTPPQEVRVIGHYVRGHLPVQTGESSHPWKGTGADGEVSIAPGRIFYPHLASGLGDISSDRFSHIPVDYAGGTVAVTGTGYLYARVAVVTQGVLTTSPQTFPDGNTDTRTPALERMTLGAITIEDSASAPAAFTPAAGGFSFPILKYADDGETIEAQYLTHNPVAGIVMQTFPV